MSGQYLADDFFPRHSQIGEDAAELASCAFLLRQRRLQLILGNDLLLDEDLAEANLTSARGLGHGRFRAGPGSGYSGCLFLSESFSARSVVSRTKAGQSLSSTISGRRRMTSSTVSD